MSFLASTALLHLDGQLQDMIDNGVESGWNTYLQNNDGHFPSGFATLDAAKAAVSQQILLILASPDVWAGVLQRVGEISTPANVDPWQFLSRVTDFTNGYQKPTCDGNDGYLLYQSVDSTTNHLDLYQLGPDGSWALATYSQDAPRPPDNALFTPVANLTRTYVVSVPTANPRDPFGIPLTRVTGELTLNPDASVHDCATDESSTEAVGNQLGSITWGTITSQYPWVVPFPIPDDHLKCATTDAVYTPWSNGPVITRGAFAVSDSADYIASYTADAEGATIDRWQRTGTTWSGGQVFGEPTFNQGFEDVVPRLAISGDGQTVAGCWMSQPPSGPFSIDGRILQSTPARYPEIFHFNSGAIDYPSTGTTDPQRCGSVSLDENGDTVWYDQFGSGWYSSPTLPALAPPSLTLPSDQTVQATSLSGAAVTWNASAEDTNGPVAVDCTPASGSLFPPGKTLVSCQASNDGGTSTGFFSVLVQTQRSQTIVFDTTRATYGQSDSSPASSDSGLPIVYSDPSGQCEIDGSGAVRYTGAGSCTITASQPGNQDYQSATPVTATIAIAPATLSVDANDASAVFGQTPSLGYTLSGFVNGEDAASAGVLGDADCSATPASPDPSTYPGAIACAPGSLAAASYVFIGGSGGTLTITKAPQAISFTTSPPSEPVYGGSYSVAGSGGGSGNPVVFSVDSASGPGACSAWGSTIDFTGAGACVIDANQAGNTDYRDAPGVQQSFSIAPAPLTVTADDQSRQFGQPNPPLTATISGFVASDTRASAVTGSPACSTPATASSPGGSYQIACTLGSLAAADYSFSFAPGTFSVTYGQTVSSSTSGKLIVRAGQAVLLAPGSTVAGPVTVQPGVALDAEGARIIGPLTSTSAIAVRLCHVTVTGPTTIGATSGPVVLGDDDGSKSCRGSQLVGPVKITAGGGVEFDGNTVTGPLTITGNTGLLAPPDTGAVDATGNSVSGPTDIQP